MTRTFCRLRLPLSTPNPHSFSPAQDRPLFHAAVRRTISRWVSSRFVSFLFFFFFFFSPHLVASSRIHAHASVHNAAKHRGPRTAQARRLRTSHQRYHTAPLRCGSNYRWTGRRGHRRDGEGSGAGGGFEDSDVMQKTLTANLTGNQYMPVVSSPVVVGEQYESNEDTSEGKERAAGSKERTRTSRSTRWRRGRPLAMMWGEGGRGSSGRCLAARVAVKS